MLGNRQKCMLLTLPWPRSPSDAGCAGRASRIFLFLLVTVGVNAIGVTGDRWQGAYQPCSIGRTKSSATLTWAGAWAANRMVSATSSPCRKVICLARSSICWR